MKIREITLHNYRAIKDATFYVADYGLLIGANNCGKTSVLDAIRNCYEKDIKFDHQRDFPKFATDDKETWVEIEYELTKDEAASIKAEYLQKANRFRVRKILHSDDKSRLHHFAYEGGALSANQFYGDDNVGMGKLGDIIHIPAVSKLEDVSKFSGASPLRELVNNIFKKLVKGSTAFTSFQDAISKFGQDIQTEQTADKRSLKGLEDDINAGSVHGLPQAGAPVAERRFRSAVVCEASAAAACRRAAASSANIALQRHLDRPGSTRVSRV